MINNEITNTGIILKTEEFFLIYFSELSVNNFLFRCLTYSIIPGSIEIKMMAIIVIEKLSFTKGILPKK